MISESEAKCAKLQKKFEDTQAPYEEGQSLLRSLKNRYNNVISWAELYSTADLETKKMIVNCLIRRIEVDRGYKLHVDFNIDFTQFDLGLEIRCNKEPVDKIKYGPEKKPPVHYF